MSYPNKIRITSADPAFAPEKAKDVELVQGLPSGGKPSYHSPFGQDFICLVAWNTFLLKWEYEFEDFITDDYARWVSFSDALTGDYAPSAGTDAFGTAVISAVVSGGLSAAVYQYLMENDE